MLISPPFLLPRQANETDEAFVARCMPDSAATVPGTQIPMGSYPVSYNLGWHGGMHLQAPAGAAGAVENVRAIADGEIVFVRKPTASNGNPSPGEPRNYNPFGSAPAWTDDGCVIIRHRTEIGATPQGQATEVEFFSVYMHLSELRGAAHRVASGAASRTVHRKDEIGVAGRFYGAHHQLHLEIICDDDNLRRLADRVTGDVDMASDGRTDAVFGEMYFGLPVGTRFYAQRPQHGSDLSSVQVAHTLEGEAVFVGVRYAGGEGRQGDRGDANLVTYLADGSTVGDPVNENNAEYDLYKSATTLSNAYPAASRPAPSAVYELLRFGRVVNTEHETLSPADVPHWRKARYPGGGEGWVNLNAGGVCKYSDADFPQWRGWSFIDDDTDGDSRCNSARLIALIEDPTASDGTLKRPELLQRMGLTPVRDKLKRTICKFPSEWDSASSQARWGWLNGDPEFGLDAPNFAELMAHLSALTIDWAGANLGIGVTHWHWQPREFINSWSRCGWLSRSELARIYVETPTAVLDANVLALNRMMRKYIIQSPLRQSHFLGQGAVESDFLRAMQEKSMEGTVEPTRVLGRRINAASTVPERDLGHWYGELESEDDPWFRLEKHNSRGVRITGSYSWVNGNVGDTDAQKFRGRGFKQLTGLDNYAEYWVYRGWLRRDSFDRNWWDDPQYRHRNPAGMRLRPATVNDPQRVVRNPENCMDSGGWYMTFRRPGVMAAIDGDVRTVAGTPTQLAAEQANSRAVTFAINGGYIDELRRLQYTRRAKDLLL